MKIEKIDHVAILVKDTKEAAKFFTDLFETEFTSLGVVKEMDVRSMIEPSGIELVEPLTPQGPTTKTLESRGGGLSLLSLRVENLDNAMAEMKQRGIRIVRQAGHGTMKVALYDPRDTYGVMIELIELKSEHPIVTANRMEKDIK
jgi:methylmalonyl-CoA epimerase